MNTSKILTAVACISMAASQAGCAAPETESIGSDGQPFATALAASPFTKRSPRRASRSCSPRS